MPTLDETLGQFSDPQFVKADYGDASVPRPDPLAAALETLRAVGAIPPEAAVGQELSAPTQLNVGQGTAIPYPSGPGQMPPEVGDDRAAAEHDTVSNPTADLSGGTAGYDPNAPQFSPYQSPGSTAEATQSADNQLATAAAAQTSLEEKKLAAQGAQQTRIADAYQASADEQGRINHDSEMERMAINAKADADTATWVQDLQDQATREPNPHRWWNNQGALGRALWGLGMLAGAANVAITPGARNAAMDMVMKEVDQDIEAQGVVLKNSMAALKERGGAIKEKYARDADFARDKHTAKLTRLQALERGWVARATIPGDLDAEVAKQAGVSWLQTKQAEVAEQRRQEYVSADSARAAERHAQRMQGARQAFEKKEREATQLWQQGQKALDRQIQRDLAPVTLDVKGTAPGSTRNPIGKDGKPLYDQLAARPDAQGRSRVVVTGGSATDGAMLFSDHKDFEGANATIEASDEHFHALVRLRNALSAQSAGANALTSLAGVTDPELNSAIMELGGALAKAQNGGRPTDKDFSNAIQQTMGFDANGNWLQRGKFTVGSITPIVQRQIDEHTKRVQAKLQGFNNEAVNGPGSKVIYRPADLDADTVQQQNSREAEGKGPATLAPGQVSSDGSAAPLKGADDYRKRVAAEAEGTGSQRGFLLPDHDRSQVEAVMARAQNAGPATIRAKANETLDALKEQKAALDAKFDKATDPWSGSTDDPRQVFAESARIGETIHIVETVSKDLEAKATKALDRFKQRTGLLQKWGVVTSSSSMGARGAVPEETIRKVARDEGLTDSTEVEETLAKFRK